MKGLSHSFTISLLVLTLAACDMTPAQEPAYLRVDALALADIQDEPWAGNTNSHITTTWVEVDGVNLGAFDLPMEIPVIVADGMHEVKLYPGIDINGIAGFRGVYPFYEPLVSNILLGKGSVSNLPIGNSPYVIAYGSNCMVGVNLEDFNSAGRTMVPAATSDTSWTTVSSAQLKFPPINGESNVASGMAILNGGIGRFEAVSNTAYSLPTGGDNVYVELDYRSTLPVTIGVIANRPSGIIQQPTATLYPKDEWSHAYINLVTEVSGFPDAYDYQIFIGTAKDSTGKIDTILIDNMRMIYCP